MDIYKSTLRTLAMEVDSGFRKLKLLFLAMKSFNHFFPAGTYELRLAK